VKKNHIDVYQIVTDRIIAMLESGVVPWNKPWTNAHERFPTNFTSKRAYRGINIVMLSMARFASPYWLTYRQAAEMGGHIRAGEAGMPVIFFKMLDHSDAPNRPRSESSGNPESRSRSIPILRYYTVFNLQQCENLPVPESVAITTPIAPISACEAIVQGMPNRPTIEHIQGQAFYNRTRDLVNMPPQGLFEHSESYYSTLFHELVHATGHPARLDRQTLVEAGKFGDENYSKEELVAEMGATFLCSLAGIENQTIENSAAYISNWLTKLRTDRKLLVQAGSAAQKAVDFITNTTAAAAAATEEALAT
jgi:antirestriction protein ArdC